MTASGTIADNLPALDNATRSLVQIAAAIAGAGESKTREVMERAAGSVDPSRVDEVILQSYLFAANAYGRLAVNHRKTRTVVSERCVDTWKAGWQFGIELKE